MTICEPPPHVYGQDSRKNQAPLSTVRTAVTPLVGGSCTKLRCSSTAMKRKTPSIAGESQEIKDVMQQQPKPSFSDAPPQPLCQIEGSSGRDQGLFEKDVRPTNNGGSTHAAVESLRTQQRTPCCKRIAGSSSKPKNKKKETLKPWQIPEPSVSQFMNQAVDFIKVLLPEDAIKIRKSNFNGNWKTLEEITRNQSHQRDRYCNFLLENRQLSLIHFTVPKVLAKNERRYMLFHTNCFAGNLLFQQLGLEKEESKLLVDIYKNWLSDGISSSILKQKGHLIFKGIDYGNKALLLKLSRMNQLFSTPLFSATELAELQRNAFHSISEVWKRSHFIKSGNKFDLDIAKEHQVFAPMLLYFFDTVRQKDDLMAFSWVVFEAWAKQHLAAPAQIIFHNNEVIRKVKEAINDIDVMEAIANLDLEVADKLV
ncbi:hypothetical protein O181_034891 [Austropuccinia psidii MF-1]|uniref:Uncharacterized protein n=1 Tax=Austropuccinia psidii MF-1 TaxID=1389203 RepID=A0A9Q3H8G2_9BASI|nr:hypothetical protein [Austropuccinia psidii MF-1]